MDWYCINLFHSHNVSFYNSICRNFMFLHSCLFFRGLVHCLPFSLDLNIWLWYTIGSKLNFIFILALFTHVYYLPRLVPCLPFSQCERLVLSGHMQEFLCFGYVYFLPRLVPCLPFSQCEHLVLSRHMQEFLCCGYVYFFHIFLLFS